MPAAYDDSSAGPGGRPHRTAGETDARKEHRMRLTKLGHACVRLERDGRALVIDPGSFSEPDAAVGADAVLITHEHPDHLDADRLRAAIAHRSGLEIWTNPSGAGLLDGIGAPVHVVGHGDAFTAAGFEVQVHGEHHAQIHPDIPVVRNVCFLVDGAVFHPGDSFTLPDAPVTALLLPVHAPWMKASEAVEYVRRVRPDRAFALHDAMLNERGLALTDRLFGGGIDLGCPFRRLAPGEAEEIA
jgi:L-ascorbate metabolism protein UlaG (beta-lactamase superfamily)